MSCISSFVIVTSTFAAVGLTVGCAGPLHRTTKRWCIDNPDTIANRYGGR